MAVSVGAANKDSQYIDRDVHATILEGQARKSFPTAFSYPGDDVSHHDSVGPRNDAGIDICHFEEQWNL